MAERLGTGLQNPLQRFESASDLKPQIPLSAGFFIFHNHTAKSRQGFRRGI